MSTFTTTRIRHTGSGNMPLYVRGLHRSVYVDALRPADWSAIVEELTSRGPVPAAA